MKKGFLLVILLVFLFVFSIIVSLRLETLAELVKIVRLREKRVLLSITVKSCQQALEFYWEELPATSFEIDLNGFNIFCELVDFNSTEATYSYTTTLDGEILNGYFNVKH
ncbi:MAG: hypothetical protein PWQ20_570 [Thermotogaceae bacterium]|jgi:hypothetical protein|nr:hypothetical protein [Thermotogaceae bacterium]MDN5337500.1 hypothetical protein [Thermotogaceae bacterium]